MTILGGIAAVATLILGLMDANGAPQQAAVAAMSAAYVIIPYCIARAINELTTIEIHEKATKQPTPVSAVEIPTPTMRGGIVIKENFDK